MKSTTFKCFIAILCLLVTDISYGQKSSARKKKKSANTSLPYCEDAIAAAKKSNQAQADADCSTVYQCVPCKEKASKKETCKSVTVQPKCKNSVSVNKKQTSDASTMDEKPLPITVEILQQACGSGKVNLNAVVVTDGQSSFDKKSQQDYDFQWTIDGKDASNTSDLSCIKAKDATLKVTQKTGGGTVTLYILPNNEEPLPARGAAVPNFVASYKKTGCFGQCPIYEVQFFEDGRVKWEGKMNVGTPGIKEAKLDKESLAEIARVAEKIKFFEMDRQYPDYQVWDAPSTVIYLNLNGKEHQVEDILSAPAELKELEQVFDDIIKKQGWRTSPDKKSKAAKSASNSKN
jgi:hypothetical protein